MNCSHAGIRKAIPYLVLIPNVVIILCLACRHQNDEQNKFATQITDKSSFYSEVIFPHLTPLGLQSLQNGADSLELRIWHFFSFSDSADVYLLRKYPDSEWFAERIRFPIKARNMSPGCRKQITNSGGVLWQKLISLGITSFDGMSAQELGKYADGELAIIELATKSYYKRCSTACSLAYKSERDATQTSMANAFIETMFDGLKFPEEVVFDSKSIFPKK